jgi:hypothetical protein
MNKKFPLPFEIITCPQWGARRPKQGIETVGASNKTIFHHTAGHHRQLDGTPKQTREESMAYARAIHVPMDGNGWIDSGHSAVSANGAVLQGRLTVQRDQAGAW